VFPKIEFIGVGIGGMVDSDQHVEQAVTLINVTNYVVMVCGFALQPCIGVYLIN